MIQIKQNDTARLFTDQLTLADENVDLTDATVVLIWHNQNTSAVTRRDAEITDAQRGKVSYQPLEEDVSQAGVFDLEWEVTFPSGGVLTFPTSGYGKLRINADLDSLA
jgi:hypothetical protein